MDRLGKRQGPGRVGADRRLRQRLARPARWQGARHHARVDPATTRSDRPRTLGSDDAPVHGVRFSASSVVGATSRSPSTPYLHGGAAEAGSTRWSPNGTRPSPRTVVVASLGVLALVGLTTQPWLGLVTGALVALALVRPRLRFVLSSAQWLRSPPRCCSHAVQQLRWEYPPILEWPQFFERIHMVGWAAVVFLVADTLVTWLRSRSAAPEDEQR